MQSLARCTTFGLKPAAIYKATAARRNLSRNKMTVRAQQETNAEQAVAPQPDEAVVPPAAAVATPAAASASAAAVAQPFSLLGDAQEAINGRAAMLGFVVAIFTELATKQSVWSQIAGKYVDQDLVERPIGASTLFFGFIVVMTTLATFAPQVFEGQGPASRSFGPFTPAAELRNGRAAMVGFLALLLVELVRGNTPLF